MEQWWKKYFEETNKNNSKKEENSSSECDFYTLEDIKDIMNTRDEPYGKIWAVSHEFACQEGSRFDISLDAQKYLIDNVVKENCCVEALPHRANILKGVVSSPSFEYLSFQEQKELYGCRRDKVYDDRWINTLRKKLLTHPECTEEDVALLAAMDSFNDKDSVRSAWEGVFLDSKCSDDIAAGIIFGGTISEDAVDKLLESETCPKKVFTAALEQAVESNYSRYYHCYDYVLDGSKLCKIANHKDADSIVLEEVASLVAGELLETNGDTKNTDTCRTAGCYRSDIIEAVLNNKNCTEKVASKLCLACSTLPLEISEKCGALIDEKFPKASLLCRIDQFKKKACGFDDEYKVSFIDQKEAGNVGHNKEVMQAYIESNLNKITAEKGSKKEMLLNRIINRQEETTK